MKPSEILRKAARYLERYWEGTGENLGTCAAICEVSDVRGYDHEEEPMATMVRLFGKHQPNTYWWGSNQSARIIGICLAAAIAESEGQ